jgi:trehalose 6-phosphate synthase/phosphatase
MSTVDGTMAARSTYERPLVLVSNRLPVSLERGDGAFQVRMSSGGLATALSGVSEEAYTWIGWPGLAVDPAEEPEVERALHEHGLRPVFLSAPDLEHYYQGFGNGVVWPLFHYFTDRVIHDADAFHTYLDVNRRFAERIAEEAPEGAHVWIHDFHLLCVSGELRRLRPDVGISFFLHIPFPSSELYRMIPKREELLRGMLGADYIGFHTQDYARHFRNTCLRVLGAGSTADAVLFGGRRVGIGVHPIGVPVSRFEDALASEAATAFMSELAERYRGRKVILAVERLDYTKGIPLKLQAFETFLARSPERAQEVVMLQVLVPSRLDNPEYQGLKREIDEAIGRINGAFGSPGYAPIEYLNRSLEPHELVGLYAFADVAFVTPVRDGMNLVAQEYCLCQSFHSTREGIAPGVLVLSEFAGVANSLSRALLVNPWDVEGVADALEQAFSLSEDERVLRMRTMGDRVRHLDCHGWAREFCRHVERWIEEESHRGTAPQMTRSAAREIVRRAQDAPRRVLFLDYDGTLREIVSHPDAARPTEELRSLLLRLAMLPDTDVHVVSGRDRRTLDAWLGDLPVGLCAEHGFYTKAPHGEWREAHHVDLSWMDGAEEILRGIVQEVPGSLLEKKAAGLAWHYRLSDEEYAEWRALELRAILSEEFASLPIEVLRGHKVLEMRASGVNKGAYLRANIEGETDETFILCIGDDRTDFDMYAALPPHGISLHVGGEGHGMNHRLESPREVRALLESIYTALKSSPPSADTSVTVA